MQHKLSPVPSAGGRTKLRIVKKTGNRFIQRVRSRHDPRVVYSYFRRDGQSRKLPGIEGSPEWFAAYAALINGHDLPPQGPNKIDPNRAPAGSVGAVIAHYLDSSAYRDLEPNSRKAYNVPIRVMREKGLGPVAMADLSRATIVKLLDAREKAAPGGYNDMLRCFRALIRQALDMELITVDPTAKLRKRPQINPDGYFTWTEADVDQYRARHPVGTEARLAFEIVLATGARGRSDARELGWQNVTGGVISFTPRKTKNMKKPPTVHIPVVDPNLIAVLTAVPTDRVPRHFLLSAKGLPYSEDHYSDLFRTWIEQAGLPVEGKNKRSPHGLRKLFATRMADNGADLLEIAAALGDTPESAQIYIEKRDRRAASERAVRKYLAGGVS